MSRRQISALVAAAIGVLAVGLLVLLARAPAQRGNIPNAAVVGEPAPETAGTDLEGQWVDLADFRGQWVVVNFFATWCAGCVQEHPELVEFSRRHEQDQTALVLSIVWSDKADAVRDFFEERGGDWPVIMDPGTIGLSYGVTAVPESYLVAPSGRIVEKFVGATGVTADAIDASIASFSG